jgi:excinuclease ABC subunit C
LLAPRSSVGNADSNNSPESRRDGATTLPTHEPSAPAIAVFLYQNGKLCGPAIFSTLGMRIQNEHSGSSSLFAQPMALEAIPEQGTGNREPASEDHPTATQRKAARNMLEARIESVLAELSADKESPNATERQGHLALLKRWYYRPEVKRPGEIFFPDADGQWPIRAILRGAGRIAAKSLTPAATS